MPAMSRRGSTAIRRLLDTAAGGARSEAERLIIRLLRQAQISGWTANFAVGGYVIDIAFPHQRVAIEIDGWAFFHSDQATFQNDRVRQNRLALQLAGPALHLAGPNSTPGPGAESDTRGHFGALTSAGRT